MKRSAGILLPIASLPSPYGIGAFDESAYRFVDWLKSASQSWWQILPLGPTGYGDSPYQSFSTFAGNPYFISLGELVKEGLLTKQECESADLGNDPHRIDYHKQYQNRYSLLYRAYQNSDSHKDPAFRAFCRENPWLEDYALFMALKDAHGGKAWNEWDRALQKREPEKLEESRHKLADGIGFHRFLQYHFYRQWSRLKAYANQQGIGIIGDIPIYIAADSADVWASPSLFLLGEDNLPLAVAGCPPDAFSPSGQLWGNPLYRWEAHKATGYRWWIDRLSHTFRLYDVVRIDHFRGFDEYYSIPYGAKTAKDGHWEKGPGLEPFEAAWKVLGKQAVIAEDLGFMTDSVRAMVQDSGFPNMKVLQFAFDGRDTGSQNDHLPHNYGENAIAYTGTHDNQTLVSWLATITSKEKQMVRNYLCDGYTPDALLPKSLIALLLQSKAALAMVPMQDWLRLDDRCRTNTPSTMGENWKWRMGAEDLSNTLAREIGQMTKLYGREGKRL